MTISVRLNEEDTKLIRKYAQLNNISLSDLIRNSIIEKIEDEYDLESYEKSMEEYSQNGIFSFVALANIRVLAEHNDLDNDFIINMYSAYGMSFDELEEIIGKDKLKNIFDPKEFTKFF